MSDVLTRIYNSFDPDNPLPANDPAYVECGEVRGENNILKDLGNGIRRSEDKATCQLYVGHRGAGKSTELLRLKQDLEEKGCFVVYFAADAEDVDPEDAEYVDVLLACTRHLLEELKAADAQPLRSWLRDRWRSLEDLMLTEISFDELKAEAQLSQFGKLSTAIRATPTERQKIRQQVNPHTPSLIDALNQFIADAKKKLPNGKTQLVVIADNLDRIVPIPDATGRTNHDHIFLERSGQLKALKCHLIYTVPISMFYSSRANDLKDTYGNAQVLPMIMVRTKEGSIHPSGFEKIKEVIVRRIRAATAGTTYEQASIDQEILESAEVIEQLCLMSGGHIRELVRLCKEASNNVDELPITAKAARRAITVVRDTYRRTVQSNQWALLANVAVNYRCPHDEAYRELLYSRCILEYRYFDDDDEMQCWYDVHPLIKGIDEFKSALQKVKQ
ncbi:ATP-binding protein [Leptolyngbya sp. FACHB-711]|uniref:ATP-binding protein n=1 Tax=unclassified Leptolyngbya TaxID=2650499 RepID=UPI0018EF7F38|nr:ATP-binding protein [Leptolyngbya sp. FACHB-711]